MPMDIFKFLFGLNGASVVRGLRLGPVELVQGAVASFNAAHPRQDRGENRNDRQLELIPEITLNEILGERKAVIRLPVQKYEDGMLRFQEAMALLAVLVVENPREVLEIGTFMG